MREVGIPLEGRFFGREREDEEKKRIVEREALMGELLDGTEREGEDEESLGSFVYSLLFKPTKSRMVGPKISRVVNQN